MNVRWIAALAASVAMLAGPVAAQEVERAPVPSWVQARSIETASAPVGDAAVRVLAVDRQIRFDAEGVHAYTLQRYQVLTRQGLGSVGTVSLVWSPPHQRVEVHALRLIRGEQTIDVLETQQFETLRREDNLESAMLDGRLTATLQPRDVRVGDIVEFAFSTHDAMGALAPHLEAFDGLGAGQQLDRYSLRATWSNDHPLRVAASAPWADVRPRRSGGEWLYEIESRNLTPEQVPQDLPVRFAISRTVQFTDFQSWADASRLMAPLYERTAVLEPDSPLLAEIERIRRENDSEAARAMAALRLVQDEVRYLALAMGEGNYVPTPADEVWRSRFGDCKGKTVLLLALLEGLGIDAEPVLVSTRWGDGLEGQLPLLAWFDHVIVRARIDGRSYWMDGTRIGDRSLAGLIPPPYRQALPVRAEGAELEPIVQPPLTTPLMEVIADMDARDGLDAEAPMVVDMVSRGDFATVLRSQLGAIPPDQLEAMLKSEWGGEDAGVTIESVESRYDEAANELHLIMRGKTRLSWVNGPAGRIMAIPGTALVLPTREERRGVLASFADRPYAIEHPVMNRSVVRVALPREGRGFLLEGGDQTLEGAGYRLERSGRLVDGVAEISMTTMTLAPEVSAADMAAARTRAETAAALPLRLRAPADYAATDADRARREAGDSDVADLIERADRLSDVGDYEGALALLDAALEREPENADALKARGGARYAARDYEGARADYDRAVDLDPADQAAAAAQGIVAYAQARYDEAVVSLSVALRLDPADTAALAMRAAAYYQLGRPERALADYRALRTAAPDDPEGVAGELKSLIRLNRTEEARTVVAGRLEEDAADATALDALVRLQKQAGAPEAALGPLDAALAEAPQSIRLLGLRGRVRALTGDAEGARADFAALRQLGVGDPVLRNDVCWAQALEAFDLEQALADCDVAVASGEAAFIDSRGMVLLQMERYEEARAEYERALTGDPDLPASLFGRGLARRALGDADGAADIARARARDVDVAEDFEVFLARHPELAD